MPIAHYLKEIGRGKDGSKDLSRDEAQDAMLQVLSGCLDRLELGAFCMAMRIKGESTDEFAGFLDAISASAHNVPHDCKLVILPSYNGSRKLPNLTPLLALLLAQRGAEAGFAVLVHGLHTEARRICTASIFNALSLEALPSATSLHTFEPASSGGTPRTLQPGDVCHADLTALHPALADMLHYRTLMGVRNSGHSLVKLMRPCTTPDNSVLVTSYTHPEYLHSMGAAIAATETSALLLRGTEGEAFADPRRMPRMDAYLSGAEHAQYAVQKGSVAQLPQLPDREIDDTVRYTLSILRGEQPCPTNLLSQIDTISQLVAAL